MRRATKNNLAAVLEDTAPDLLRYLTRRVSVPEDAADLLGQIGLIAWRRRGTAPPDPHEARLWLFGIARNTLANHWRSNRRSLDLTEQLKQQLSSRTPGSDIAECLAEQDAVRTALDAIPAESAEILRLVHWDELPLVEAAAVLGIPASTARSRYATARERLRHHLQPSRLPHPPQSSSRTPVRGNPEHDHHQDKPCPETAVPSSPH